MSDDEDTYGDDGKLVPNVYTSRTPDYRAEIVRILDVPYQKINRQ